MTATPIPHIAAVCVVDQPFASPYGMRSGIDKKPVPTIDVRRSGVWDDFQGDRDHHGGVFKAVYAVAREMREELAAAEGAIFPDGFLGENIVTLGYDTDEAVIGEQWKVGTAVLEVTTARHPCKTLIARVGIKGFGRRMTDRGKCGAYFQVREPGEISAGDAIEIVHRPEHGVSVGDAFRGLSAPEATALLDWAEGTRTILYRTLAQGAVSALRSSGTAREFPEALQSDGRGD